MIFAVLIPALSVAWVVARLPCGTNGENVKTCIEKKSAATLSLVTDNSDLAENARPCHAKNVCGRSFSSVYEPATPTEIGRIPYGIPRFTRWRKLGSSVLLPRTTWLNSLTTATEAVWKTMSK